MGVVWPIALPGLSGGMSPGCSWGASLVSPVCPWVVLYILGCPWVSPGLLLVCLLGISCVSLGGLYVSLGAPGCLLGASWVLPSICGVSFFQSLGWAGGKCTSQK